MVAEPEKGNLSHENILKMAALPVIPEVIFSFAILSEMGNICISSNSTLNSKIL